MTISRAGNTPKAVTTPAAERAPKSAPAAQPAATKAAGWGAAALKMPGVQAEISELRTLTQAAKSGLLNPAQLEAKLAKLTMPSSTESSQLWSPAGAPKRAELLAALSNLSAVAPNAKLTANPVNGHQPTVKETVLQFQFAEAQGAKDGASMKKVAAEFGKLFPNSPTNKWIQDIAAR